MPEVEAHALTRAADRVRLGVAGLSAVAFAASFGFNFGVGNQVTYLIPALRLLDPGFLARDWFATHTTQYHPVFAELGALLLRLDPRGWGVALALTLTVTLAALALFGLCRRLVGRSFALAAYLTLLALLFATQTRGPLLTYVFDRELQPSTLSSACLLGAALAFTAGHTFASSVLIACGGLLHVNFAILCAPAFATAQLLLGRRDLARRLALQLALPALAVVAFLPTLRAAAIPSLDADLGRHVYLAIRAPHHFVLGPRLGQFLPLVAWHGLALATVLPLVRAPGAVPFVRLAALTAGLSVVIWGGVFCALGSERIAALFAWRLGPHLELLFQVLSIAAGVRVLAAPHLAICYGAAARALVLLALAFVLSTYAFRRDWVPAEVVASSVALALAWRALSRAREPALLAVAAGLVLANFAVGPLRRIPERSSLLVPPDREKSALCAFMRERTPKQALFLTPPNEADLRFSGGRAIVVDWKGNPAVPAEVLDWYRRIEDVTGRRGITEERELIGYDDLDARRLEALRARYGFEYAVVRRGREGTLAGYPHAFENARFVVLNVPVSVPLHDRAPPRAWK